MLYVNVWPTPTTVSDEYKSRNSLVDPIIDNVSLSGLVFISFEIDFIEKIIYENIFAFHYVFSTQCILECCSK